MTMLNWDIFRPKLGDWADKIYPFFQSGDMDIIYAFLKEEAKKGRKIAPEPSDTFKAFLATPMRDLKCVLLGLCPYHSTRGKMIIADGLAMSCSKTGILQPSLSQLYSSLEKEFVQGEAIVANREPDLRYLAEQGVLLFNIALTVEIGKPSSHNHIWEPFSRYVLREIISSSMVPVIFLGQEAAKLADELPSTQPQFFLKHPASAAYTNTEWDSCGTFAAVNKILQDANGESILWVDALPF